MLDSGIGMRTGNVLQRVVGVGFDMDNSNSRFIILSIITGNFQSQPLRTKSQLRITPAAGLKRVDKDLAPDRALVYKPHYLSAGKHCRNCNSTGNRHHDLWSRIV